MNRPSKKQQYVCFFKLKCLYKIGFKKLSGIDIQHDCLQKIKKNFNSINSIEATVYNLPFKSNSFDLVFTNNVLVHIPPKKLKNVLREMYRVSESWIWGSEYYSKNYKKIITFDQALSKVNNNFSYKIIRTATKKILKIKRIVSN